MNTQPLEQARDEDARQVQIVLMRSARRAREIAAETHTAVIVIRNGELVKEYVSADDLDQHEA
jgi:hypothetical protein